MLGAPVASGGATRGQEDIINQHRSVADLGEFGLIARMSSALPRNELTLVGPGDDAAVLRAPDGRTVTSTDLLIEQRHFRRDWSTANDIGHKAAARNFADIVAMGARPTGLLVGLAVPPDLDLDWIDGLVAGISEECADVGAAVVGGDVSAADLIVLSLTSFGTLEGRDPVLLSGARPGDVVLVAGRLGWAAAGFAVLSRGFRSPVQVVNAHRRPQPPYAAGLQAATVGLSAMTDVSDGLVADLTHIAEASGVRIDLRGDALVPDAKLRDVGSALNVDPMTWVLGGGDDYALVATARNGTQLGSDWTPIGLVTSAEASPEVRIDGLRPQVSGHQHF